MASISITIGASDLCAKPTMLCGGGTGRVGRAPIKADKAKAERLEARDRKK
jgi:hypothetical protein